MIHEFKGDQIASAFTRAERTDIISVRKRTFYSLVDKFQISAFCFRFFSSFSPVYYLQLM